MRNLGILNFQAATEYRFDGSAASCGRTQGPAHYSIGIFESVKLPWGDEVSDEMVI